jgi:hypothetical protein
MSRFFPRAEYAEDQPYSKTILTYHVLYRGWQTGAVIGLSVSGIRYLLGRNPLLLLSTGRGALIGTALMIPGLPMYMRGKTEIEWQDRSWRLLENPGQVEVDSWGSVGFVGGAVVAARREMGKQIVRGRWMRVAGGAAVGDLVGVVGYMVWRYGVNRGKWPKKAEAE